MEDSKTVFACASKNFGETKVAKKWVCQNEIMDEKTLSVVPSSWEEGSGVVETNKVRPFLNV